MKGIVTGTEETSGHTDELHVGEDVYYFVIFEVMTISNC